MADDEGTPLHQRHSDLQRICVFKQDNLRLLRLDDNAIQSAMDPAHPERLILPYMPPMLAWLLFRPMARRALVLGLGGGDLVRYLHHAMPKASITAVDYDPAIIEVAQTYFALPENDRITLAQEDARHFLARDKHQFDVIFVDLYGNDETPVLHAEDPLFALAHDHLNSDGVLVMNMITEDEVFFARTLLHLRTLFNRQTLCIKVHGHKNIIVFAYIKKPAPVSRAGLQQKVDQLTRQFGLNFDLMVENLFTTNPIENNELMF